MPSQAEVRWSQLSAVDDARSRCLVPADGWYEWLKAEDPKQPRKPMHFSLPERRPFAFAG